MVAALDGYAELLHHPALLITGFPFSLTLITILLAHELGHYLACLYYGVDATAPFVPLPSQYLLNGALSITLRGGSMLVIQH